MLISNLVKKLKNVYPQRGFFPTNLMIMCKTLENCTFHLLLLKTFFM
jgi:hypothetical protein